MKEHLREHKLTTVDFKEACSKCNARFLYNSELLHHIKEHDIVECQVKKSIKVENNDHDGDAVMKTVKEEEEDDYIEIEKVPEN